MIIKKFAIAVFILTVAACSGGSGGSGGGTTGGGGGGSGGSGGGGGSIPDVAGTYTLTVDATTMNCATGPVPLLTGTMQVTVTQSGNKIDFDGTPAGVPITPGAVTVDECTINADRSFQCTGSYTDANGTTTWTTTGQFTGTGYDSISNLKLVMTGDSCTWTSTAHAVKL